MIKEIDAILDKNQSPDRHSFFQLQHFILNGEPTIQAKLQVCLRELKSRRATLVNIERECEDIQDKNELTTLELDRLSEDVPEDDKYAQKEYEILVRQLHRKIAANKDRLEDLKEKYNYVSEECQFFMQAFSHLSEKEPLKPWDDIGVQKQYWDTKINNMLNLRLILGLPMDEELVKTALSLHDGAGARQQVERLIASVKQELKAIPTAKIDLDFD